MCATISLMSSESKEVREIVTNKTEVVYKVAQALADCYAGRYGAALVRPPIYDAEVMTSLSGDTGKVVTNPWTLEYRETCLEIRKASGNGIAELDNLHARVVRIIEEAGYKVIPLAGLVHIDAYSPPEDFAQKIDTLERMEIPS